jgi:hypothetical protein
MTLFQENKHLSQFGDSGDSGSWCIYVRAVCARARSRGLLHKNEVRVTKSAEIVAIACVLCGDSGFRQSHHTCRLKRDRYVKETIKAKLCHQDETIMLDTWICDQCGKAALYLCGKKPHWIVEYSTPESPRHLCSAACKAKDFQGHA